MIVVRVKVSRGFEPFSPWGSTVRTLVNRPHGEIRVDKSHLLTINPARQKYRYTSVPIEAAKVNQCCGLGSDQIRLDLISKLVILLNKGDFKVYS